MNSWFCNRVRFKIVIRILALQGATHIIRLWRIVSKLEVHWSERSLPNKPSLRAKCIMHM